MTSAVAIFVTMLYHIPFISFSPVKALAIVGDNIKSTMRITLFI